MVIAPGSGKAPGGVPRGFPVRAPQRAGISGQRVVAIFGALPTVAMALEALAIKVGALYEEGFMESQAQAVDG